MVEPETLEHESDQELTTPLALLRNVVSQLTRRDIPLSRHRLDGLFAHLQGAVAEVLDYAQGQLEAGLEDLSTTAEEVGEAHPDDPEVVEEAAQLFEAFEDCRGHIHGTLEELRETFFSADGLADLERNHDFLASAEARLEEGLHRIELVLARAESPDLFQLSDQAKSAEVGTALDSLGLGLECLETHLEDGDKEHIRTCLTHLEQARYLLERALQDEPEKP